MQDLCSFKSPTFFISEDVTINGWCIEARICRSRIDKSVFSLKDIDVIYFGKIMFTSRLVLSHDVTES